ncbi:hypothetical protein [Maribacter thermophilus]|uniref:hypothetical protein n=1 Tax=Maribacter thermophilus TaxID=1197874 RepID=UPI0006412AD8|nr:hypothetical protein [Maribacter thermophilus]
MEYKYFGFLKEKDFPEGEYDAEIRYLQKHSLLEKDPSLFSPPYYDKGNKIWIVPVNENATKHLYYNLTPHVLQEYYMFLKDHYQKKIDGPFLEYSLRLDDELYGLDRNSQNKIALKKFKDLFNTIDIFFVSPEKQISPQGIEHMQRISRTKLLHKAQNAMKQRQRIYDDSIKQFLLGNKEYFNDHLAENNTYIAFTIKFESELKILLSLNDRFKFEEDHYFGINAQLRQKYERHNGLSFNFSVFKFIHTVITGIEKHTHSHVVSLYYFLHSNQYIKEDAKAFQDFINAEYSLDLKRIKINNPYNEKHLERIKKFTDLFSNNATLEDK